MTEKPPVGYPTLRRKVRRDILRSWPQFAAVVCTAVLGVALFAASFDAYRNLQESYDKVFSSQQFADLWVTGGDTGLISDVLSDGEGVADVRTRTQVDLPVAAGRHRLSGRVVGYPATGQPSVNRLTKLSGSWLTGPDTALVEQHMAESLGLEPGDSVTVRGAPGPRTLRIEGVVSSGEYLWPARSRQEPLTDPEDFGVLFVPEHTARALAGQEEGNQVLVQMNGAAREKPGLFTALSRTAVRYGATDVLTRAEQPSNAVLSEDIAGFREMALAFPLLFLSAAGLSTYVLLTRRVASERPFIGMLRAAGAKRRTVALHYLAYGVVATGGGAVLGVALGTVGARILSRVYVHVIDLPDSAAVVAAFRPVTVGVGLAFGLLAGGLAAAGPALLASRVAPAEAMRGTVPAVAGGRSWVEGAVPLLRRLPARWRMVVRGIGRHRGRTFFTAAGVSLALLLVLTAWTMLDSVNALVRTQFDDVVRSDAQVELSTPADAASLRTLGDVRGVAAAEPVVERPVAVVSGESVYGTTLRAMRSGTTMHRFRTPSGGSRPLPRSGVLLGEAAGDRLGVSEGDEVTLRLPGYDSTVQARVAGFVDEPLGTFAYARAGWLQDVVGDVPARTVLLRFDAGADPDAVRARLTSVDAVTAYTDNRAVERLWDDYAGLFTVFVGSMLVLGGVMAFGVLFTTMSVNIVERRRELATLRAAGVRHAVLARLVTGENLLVSLLGVAPGLFLGLLGARLLLASYSSDQFTFDVVVRPGTWVLAAAGMVAVSLLSQWPGLRAVRRMDVAEVVRERGD